MPIRYDDHMSDADAIMWNNERDPMLRSTIVSLMVLDREPDPVRLDAAIERSLAAIPRLRQHVVLDPLRAAPPCWRGDENFDRRYHVRHVALPCRGSLRDLLDFAEPVAMQSFDKDRPLWEMYRIDGMEGGRSALLIKLHHTISDGVGLVRMTSSLVEREREPGPGDSASMTSVAEAVEPEHGAFYEAVHALRYRAGSELDRTTRFLQALGRSAREFAADPAESARSASDLASSIIKTLRPVTQRLSPVMVGRSLGARFELLEYPLDALKAAARAVGGGLNCAFVGGVTGGLRLYHERLGHPVEQLRMTMPINIRSGEKGSRAGNQFAPARFAVPVDIPDPVERMRQIAAAAERERREPVLPLIDEVAGVLSELPEIVTVNLFGSMLKAIDLITSNVPGPPFPVFASGAKVEKMFGFGPLSGAATNITLFSYDGRVYVAVNMDPAAVVDMPGFIECLRDGMDEVLALA